MGNYRFRFWDMIPNAWFYKVNGLSNKSRGNHNNASPVKKHHHQPPPSLTSSSSSSATSNNTTAHLSHQRKSYYFARDLTPTPPTFYDDDTATSSNAHFSQPPRQSSSKKKRIATATRNKSSTKSDHRPSPRLLSTCSVSTGCSFRASSTTIESVWTKPDSTTEDYPNSPVDTSSDNESIIPEFCSSRTLSPEMLSWSSVSCSCRVDKKDIFIDVQHNPHPLRSKLNDKPPPEQLNVFDSVSELDLPPIITNIPSKFCGATKSDDMKDREKKEPTKFRAVKEEDIFSTGTGYGSSWKEQQKTSPAATRRFSVNNSSSGGGGLKLRTNSPRIANKRISQARKSISSRRRRSLSESFAVVKSSEDPQRDFRESMVEMIVENNIRASKDLEDLLACYLSLNSNEYHELIIRVFKQIWFDIVDVRRPPN